jgi:hypothetical protein
VNADQQRALDVIAAERAASMKPPPPPVTLESLHQRLTALENHPALKHQITYQEQPNG